MDDFCFQFTAPFTGSVLAFQSVEERWYPLPLRDDQWPDDVAEGMNSLQRGVIDGSHAPLVEEDHDRRHSFAFLLGERQLIHTIVALASNASAPIDGWALDKIAEALIKQETGWSS